MRLVVFLIVLVMASMALAQQPQPPRPPAKPAPAPARPAAKHDNLGMHCHTVSTFNFSNACNSIANRAAKRQPRTALEPANFWLEKPIMRLAL